MLGIPAENQGSSTGRKGKDVGFPGGQPGETPELKVVCIDQAVIGVLYTPTRFVGEMDRVQCIKMQTKKEWYIL